MRTCASPWLDVWSSARPGIADARSLRGFRASRLCRLRTLRSRRCDSCYRKILQADAVLGLRENPYCADANQQMRTACAGG
jgi:hypothetical protein